MMDGGEKVVAILIIAIALVVSVITISITFYNHENDKIKLSMIESGVNPLIIRCFDRSWETAGTVLICSKLAEKTELTTKDKEFIKNKLEGKQYEW